MISIPDERDPIAGANLCVLWRDVPQAIEGRTGQVELSFAYKGAKIQEVYKTPKQELPRELDQGTLYLNTEPTLTFRHYTASPSTNEGDRAILERTFERFAKKPTRK